MQSQVYIEEKLSRRITELNAYRYQKKVDLDHWQVIEDTSKIEKYPPTDWTNAQAFDIDDSWKGRDYYLWIHKEIDVPEYETPMLFFDFGKTGGGHNSGFESLLFIDGAPYQGVDSNHKEVFLEDRFKGQKITLDLKLWSGLEGGGPEQIQRHHFKTAFVSDLDPLVDDLFYYGDMILKTIYLLDQSNPLRYQLLDVLNRSFLKINWQMPGSTEFYESLHEADQFLKQALEDIEKDTPITITALGHTHIDVAWLWRLKHTREKTARSFSTVLKLMEKYPEYVFLHTTPQVYKYVKEDYPEIYQQIKKRVAEGRWEIDGAMWLESDCNIPSGESLTRQILHGKKFIKEEFDKDIHYLWLPDVFGYSWALPQILRKSDIDTFMTTKISWNQFNRMPHDTFYWKGIDGTDVLTHFVTTPTPSDHGHDGKSWFYTYNGELEPSTVLGIYQAYQDKDFNQNLLLSYGHGDGGGGVTRDMLEKRRRLDQIPGLPHVKTGRADDYFKELHETVENTDHYVHTWDGELYLEYHRGTYTSQAFVKKMNRRLELALRELEVLYTAVSVSGKADYPTEALYTIWETVLRNQFHDIIPGSSIKEVYQDYRQEIGECTDHVDELFAKLTNQSLDKAKSRQYTIVNTAGWSRKSTVTIAGITKGVFKDDSGRILKSVVVDGDTVVSLPEIPALSTIVIDYVLDEEASNRESEQTAKVIDHGVETPLYRIIWNDQGHLTHLYDKENHREALKGTGNVLQLFEDKPMNFDAWDIDIYYQEKVTELEWQSAELVENNATFADVVFTCHVNNSTILQTMRLYANDRRIDFITDVDWNERQQLLKTKFDVAVRNTEATYDIQYGNVKRPTHWNTSWDLAKFETVGHQWADLSQRDYGVSLLNDSKYGYDIKENQMRLSLLKGGIYPDPTADIGKHHFTYSLLPHLGDFVSGRTVEEAWEINQPLTVLDTSDSLDLPFKIEGSESLAIDAIKEAEDGNGWIIRFHEHVGSTKTVSLTIPEGYQWLETNLVERNLSETMSDGPIKVALTPYEIKTIRIVVK